MRVCVCVWVCVGVCMCVYGMHVVVVGVPVSPDDDADDDGDDGGDGGDGVYVILILRCRRSYSLILRLLRRLSVSISFSLSPLPY